MKNNEPKQKGKVPFWGDKVPHKAALAKIPLTRLTEWKKDTKSKAVFRSYLATGVPHLGWEIHHIAAGDLVPRFKPKEKDTRGMCSCRIGGSMGNAQVVLQGFPGTRKTAVLMREVPSEYRRRKIGTDLLNIAVEIAKREGANHIIANTSRTNKAAISSYESAGWEVFDDSDSKTITYGLRLKGKK